MIQFLILSLNKSKIVKTINILHCLIKQLGLENIVENKIILIKDDY